ncbi:hypothetical protein [Domibacillus indicus]|uniref:hypothetical protein n=1 Tax=Domibacillus indicus TaxID=1437523 RepID=UPI00061811C4|nr:hypothetical protein [Domibacillus indicus]
MKLFLRALLGTVVYYVILLFVFLTGREKRWEESAGHPIEERWDQNSTYVDNYFPFLAWPLLVILIWGYCIWLFSAKNTKEKIVICISMIPVGFCYLVFIVFIAMLGYQP